VQAQGAEVTTIEGLSKNGELRGVAADVRAGELKLLADQLHEQRARIDVRRHGFAVDGQADGNAHGCLLVWTATASVAVLRPILRARSSPAQRGLSLMTTRA
jgi:hypothetical protein